MENIHIEAVPVSEVWKEDGLKRGKPLSVPVSVPHPSSKPKPQSKDDMGYTKPGCKASLLE